jgi:hypothetical protein
MKKFIFIVAVLSVIMLFLPLKSYAATASAVIDCNNELCDISPYIFGQNTSSVYYKAPLTNQLVIDKVKRMGLRMWRFFPGAAGQRYDFKYNNYKGKYWNGGGTPAAPEPWNTDEATVPSIEDELRFCDAVGAEPLVEVNSAFVGPNGTHYDNGGGWTGGDDFPSYTGYPGTDTPQTRAQYAADMVTYINSLCDVNGWAHPVYYGIGNEPGWDSQPYSQYIDCFRAYYPAMKAVDPDIKIICYGGKSTAGSESLMDAHDWHSYMANYAANQSAIPYDDAYVLSPGGMDGAFLSIINKDVLQGVLNGYTTEPLVAISEWGGHSYLPEYYRFAQYLGGIYTAHTFYRSIKNKILLACAWCIWSDWSWDYHIFGPPPEFKERARFFAYEIYKNFGDRLLECYDPREYTPGVTDYFREYKDDWDELLVQASKRDEDGSIAVMAINLSDTESYDTQISLANFDMGGEIEVHTMNNSNCYEGGPGPSMNTLTGQSSPINYTFAPFTVTCLVVKGESGSSGGGEEDEVDVKVYPNPVSGGGQITFSVGDATGGEVKIYTINGNLVKELVIGTGASEVDWDVLNEDGNSITAGLYLYTVTDGNGNKKTGKLAINH